MPDVTLAARAWLHHHHPVHEEPLIYREELTSKLFAIADINVNVERILTFLEGENGGEEGLQEEDS